MDEIVPGLKHWVAFHEGIRSDVHCHAHVPSGTLFDPLVPIEGLDRLEALEPRRIVLSNRHHLRHAARLADRFGSPILCHEAGLHEFAGEGVDVQGFAFGEELAPGVTALEVGILTPEETAIRIDAGDGVLLFADSVIRGRHGEVGFVPDGLLGDDPQAVRQGLRDALRRLLDEPFDALAFAHAEPVRHAGRSALRTFVDAPTAGAPPG
jgi:hypothetical protein